MCIVHSRVKVAIKKTMAKNEWNVHVISLSLAQIRNKSLKNKDQMIIWGSGFIHQRWAAYSLVLHILLWITVKVENSLGQKVATKKV